jgi:lipopolysaccharide/colanic/teichoic acid biosynthesis glycosyltransferase
VAIQWLNMIQKLTKRLFDIAVSGWLLATFWWLFAGVALLVYLKLGSPIFFRQTRIGKGEKEFQVLKFRSMLSGDAPDAQRLTPFGQFLRASSLDELPQLWNIFMGDMSLVGPRPLLPRYLPFYRDEEKIRHTMRPGVTGLAQVSGRNGLSWDARLALDVQYVKTFSLWQDVQILWRTVLVVLQREGISAQGQATMHALDEERRIP